MSFHRQSAHVAALGLFGLAALLSDPVFAGAQLIVTGLSEPVTATSTMGATPSPGIPFEDAAVTQDPGPAPAFYTVRLSQGRASLQGPFMQWAKLAPTGWADSSRRDAVLIVSDTGGAQLTGTTIRYELRACAPYKLAASAVQGANVNVTLFALSCKAVTGPTPITH